MNHDCYNNNIDANEDETVKILDSLSNNNSKSVNEEKISEINRIISNDDAKDNYKKLKKGRRTLIGCL